MANTETEAFAREWGLAMARQHVEYAEWVTLRVGSPDIPAVAAASLAVKLVIEHERFRQSMRAIGRRHRLRERRPDGLYICPVCGDPECQAAVTVGTYFAGLFGQLS